MTNAQRANECAEQFILRFRGNYPENEPEAESWLRNRFKSVMDEAQLEGCKKATDILQRAFDEIDEFLKR